MEFPATPQEFEAIEAQGKAVQVTMTENRETPPTGDGWTWYASRVTEEATCAMWFRVIDVPQ